MVRANSRRTFLIQTSNLALLGSCAAVSALARTAPTHISIANASGGLNLTMAALMRQQKLLESFGLDPEVIAVADGTRVLGGVVGGSVDATFMSGFGQVFPAVERGAGVKILAGGALLPVLALFSAKPAVKALKDRYHAVDVTLVGHSGGSVFAADILALYPHLARAALLVSCPCDVPAFRWSMMKYQWNPLWLLPVNSVSPQAEVAKIPRETIVRMVVGSDDGLTPPPLTFAFEHSLKAKGNDVQVVVLPKLGHEIFLEPAVLEQLVSLMNVATMH